MPVFCGIWRAAVSTCDFGLYLAGPSGVFKSEVAALAQQHFGTAFDARRLPASWHSTDNALEGLLFSGKDVIVVVDDFAPHGGPHEVARWHQRADRVLRAQGNNSGRGRMRADGSLRPPKPPRGLILSTGEDIPRGQSLRARLFILEIGPDDIDEGTLTRCQQQARAGLYAAALAGFVRYMAGNYGQIRQNLRSEVEALRSKALNRAHRRTPEIMAHLAVGMRYFISYGQDAGVLSAAEGAALWGRAWKALGRAAARQTDHQMANDQVTRFLELLKSAIASGHAHLAARTGGVPDNPGAWGWRDEVLVAGSKNPAWRPLGARIGWVDGANVFLDPDASYKAAQDMAGSTGDGLSVLPQTLRKRLADKSLLIRESSKDTLTVRRVLEGARRNVLHLARGVLSMEPDAADNPDGEPSGEVRDQAACQVSMSGNLPKSPANLTSDVPSIPCGAAENRGDGRNVRNVRKRADIPPLENSAIQKSEVIEP